MPTWPRPGLGVVVATTEEAVAATERLKQARLATFEENDTFCCYPCRTRCGSTAPAASPRRSTPVRADVDVLGMGADGTSAACCTPDKTPAEAAAARYVSADGKRHVDATTRTTRTGPRAPATTVHDARRAGYRCQPVTAKVAKNHRELRIPLTSWRLGPLRCCSAVGIGVGPIPVRQTTSSGSPSARSLDPARRISAADGTPEPMRTNPRDLRCAAVVAPPFVWGRLSLRAHSCAGVPRVRTQGVRPRWRFAPCRTGVNFCACVWWNSSDLGNSVHVFGQPVSRSSRPAFREL